MTQYRFDASRWVQRLAEAIDRLLTYERAWDDVLWERRNEESVAMGLPNRIHEDTRRNRIDGYWHLQPVRRGRPLTEYEESLLDMLNNVEKVILEHPTIKGCLGRVGDFTGIRVYSPTSLFPMTMKQIVEGILGYALDCGALETASALGKRIRLGEEQNLVGSEVTLFHGLKVEGSYELPDGMVVTSLEDVEDQVDLDSIEYMLLIQRLVLVSPSSIGVLRWSYKWVPAIAAPDDSDLKFTQIPPSLNEEAGLAIMALGLVCNAPITRIGSTGDNFDRRIARALCYRDRYTTLKNLRAKLNLVGSKPAQVLNFDVFPQVSDVFSHLKQLLSCDGLGEADDSLTAQDLLAMCRLYNDFRLGKSRLTDMAYFVLTMIEKEFSRFKSDKRRRTGEKYAISRKVLKRIADLTSNAGGLGQARKALGVGMELTTAESLFLEQSARRIILRAIEVVAEPNVEREEITLSDLYRE